MLGCGGLAREVRIGVDGAIGLLGRGGTGLGRDGITVASGLRGQYLEAALLLGWALPENLVPSLLCATSQLIGADQRVFPDAQNFALLFSELTQYHGRVLGIRVACHHVVNAALLKLDQAGE